MIPRRTSDNIAVVKGVGDTEAIIERIISYYHTFFMAQISYTPELAALVPNYRRRDFETEEELYEYIQDPHYNTNRTT
jgi:hypothetical protein